jgi:DNA-binding SARP family transcriptional activator/tetratricopeptide (TPR) repeat protein
VGKIAKLSELRPTRAKKPGHLDVRLFGHLEIALDGARFGFATPRKSLQVLAYLLLHRAAPVSREYLAFLLYPDDEEDSARSKLRATLSDFSKILPAPIDRYVSIDSEKIAWKPEADLWLDVDAFDVASNDRARLGEAIDLYRGDLLPEIYDDWLDIIRERYRDAYLRCLGERISDARRNANLSLAIETARRVLALDPWREDIVRRIIAMRYENGDAAGALSEYSGFEKRLRAEMGTEPMPETTAVAERVRRGEALATEGGEAESSTLVTEAAVLPFIGRHDEMERLLQAWSRAAGGRGTCAFVGGEAGIGKSRLALELAHAVEERGGRVLVGATSSPEAIPYESIVDALRSAFPLVASLKPNVALASVASLLPEIHARVALPALPPLEAASARLRLFESLSRCIDDLAAPRPVLLILEDLHWAQSATVDLLEFLLGRLNAIRVMILVTYRDDEAPRVHALHRLRRAARVAAGGQSIILSSLSVDDVEALRAILSDMRNRTAEKLLAASQGNPLFLTQLVADVVEDERAVPASLQHAVARRVERLSEPARTVAEIASCIGDRFSRDAVREVSSWDEAALSDALDELLDRRVIRESGGRGYLEYRFSHQLMLEAIAQGVPPKDAAVRRRRVARVLETLYPERVSELSATLAAHYEFAGDAENAVRCYREAIRRSVAVAALAEARMLCERALLLATDPPTRADLLLESATIESRLGRSAEAYASGEAALACARAANDAPKTIAALCAMAHVEMHRAHFAAAEHLIEEAGSIARSVDPALELLTLPVACTIAYYMRRDIAGCIETGLRYLDLALKVGGPLEVAHAHGRLAILMTSGDARYAKAREHLAASSRIFGEQGDLAGMAAQLMNGAVLEGKLGFFERAQAATEKALDLFERAGDARGRIFALSNLVLFHALTRNVAGARTTAEEALTIARRSGLELPEASILENLSYAEAADGDYQRAIELAESSVRLRSKSDSQAWSLKTLADLAIWHARTGNLPAARDAVKRLLADEDAVARETDWPSYCWWAAAQVFHLAGDLEQAARALKPATQLLEETSNTLEGEDRERFLSLPWHVDLRAAVAGVWPSPPR